VSGSIHVDPMVPGGGGTAVTRYRDRVPSETDRGRVRGRSRGQGRAMKRVGEVQGNSEVRVGRKWSVGGRSQLYGPP
jgi:hypothetical protein